MKKGIIVAVVVVAIGVVVVASFFGEGSSGKKVDVEEAGLRAISSRVRATGEITPEKKVEISAKVVGEIIDLPVREGDAVRRGQVLVQLEGDLYETACDRARATLRQAEVQLKRTELRVADAQRTLRRVKNLYTEEIVKVEELDAADLAAQTASVELEMQRHVVEQQRSALESAEEDLARTTIRSPMDGVVIRLNAEKGETVVPGTTNLPGSVLMVIGEMSRILAEVEIGEVDVVHLEVGQEAEINVDALEDEVLRGRVVEIATSGVRDPSQGVIRFKAKVAIEDPDPRLRPSMTAKVDILTATEEEVVAVPIQAVVERKLKEDGTEAGDGDASGKTREVVYVVEEGKARLRRVQTGISDELYVQIEEGLEEGETVVVGPYRTLKELSDGDSVEPELEEDEEAPEDEENGKAGEGEGGEEDEGEAEPEATERQEDAVDEERGEAVTEMEKPQAPEAEAEDSASQEGSSAPEDD